MKIIIEEYGSVVIDAVVAVLIIGILFVFPIAGGRGIVGAIGANFSIGGGVSPGLSEADKVAQNNRATYTLDQKEDCLTVGAATPIAKSQHMREIWFYVMPSGVMLKIVVMEIARMIQMF